MRVARLRLDDVLVESYPDLTVAELRDLPDGYKVFVGTELGYEFEL